VSVRLRPALALAVVVAATVGGVAFAAPKAPAPAPVCNLLTDPKGDAYPTSSAPAGPSDDVLDVVSADVATAGKKMTVVFRMAKAAKSTSTAPTGYHLVFDFTAPGAANPLYVQYFTGNAGLPESYDFGYNDPVNGLTSLGKADGVVDTAKNEIRVTLPVNGFADHAPLKVGDKLSGITVESTRDLVVLLPYADKAATDKTYAVGAPSCVVVGK
jgi:hypothetical protein